MSDVIIFGMGCFVSLVVAGAVGLLLWGAGNEPRGEILPSNKPDQAAPRSGSTQPASASVQNLESKGLA